MKSDYVSQKHWDDGYEHHSLMMAEPNDPIRQLLERHLPRKPLSSFELGCYPGRYLSVLGSLGHTISGIDLTLKINSALPEWLDSLGFKVGTLTQADVFTHNPTDKYDVVCSFGLIEHFTNWEELFLKHASLVRSGGYLVISTPNFRSALQKTLHNSLDDINLARHNLESMDPERWHYLATESGFEVIQCGGIGHFEFWADNQKRGIIQKILLRLILKTRCFWKFTPKDTLGLSPYYAIVARKPVD